MALASVLLVLVAALRWVACIRSKRRRSWRAVQTVGGGTTRVTLTAGPWSGKVVRVPGVPVVGSALTSWTFGLVGNGVHTGRYTVTDCDAEARTAVASWELDTNQGETAIRPRRPPGGRRFCCSRDAVKRHACNLLFLQPLGLVGNGFIAVVVDATATQSTPTAKVLAPHEDKIGAAVLWRA